MRKKPRLVADTGASAPSRPFRVATAMAEDDGLPNGDRSQPLDVQPDEGPFDDLADAAFRADDENIAEQSDDGATSGSDLMPGDLLSVAEDDDLLEMAGMEQNEISVAIAGYDAFQHKQSGVIHYRDDFSVMKLLCSRLVTASYSNILKPMKQHWPACMTCKSRIVTP